MPTTTPDEGGGVHQLELDTWKLYYEAVKDADPTVGPWFKRLVTEAAHQQVSFHMGGETPVRTERRLSILMGLVRLARAGEHTDGALRSLLALTWGEDWPFFPNVLPGHALGLLDAARAATFAAHAEALALGALTSAGVSPDGEHVRLIPAA